MPTPAPTLDSPDRGLLQALLGDGRFLVMLTGISLTFSGGFALLQSATGHFLPHDIAYLGMTADELCGINECRVVHFMFHDRVSFGGVLIGIGALYLWLAEFPLKQREAWAWWTLALSGAAGFASFLTYLGYGYLDSWHGTATLLLLPCFLAGLFRSWPTLNEPKGIAVLLRPSEPLDFSSASGWGRNCLIATAAGVVGAGVTISFIGMTTVFVPQDLAYMGLDADALRSINPRLVSLIAHDRAGFGGGLVSGGVALLAAIWCSRPSKSLWQVLLLAGGFGFSAAVGIHFVVGYTDALHLAPAVAGAALWAIGLILSYPHLHAAGHIVEAPKA